jgi:hypothetical protein
VWYFGKGQEGRAGNLRNTFCPSIITKKQFGYALKIKIPQQSFLPF